MDGDLHRTMKSTFFDRGQDLVLIEAHLVGHRSDARLNLVLDTGASNTMVTPDVMDQIGYSARDGLGLSAISSPLGREFGYRIRVDSFEVLAFPFPDFSVAVHDFTNLGGIDGLLGWDFLQRFNLDVRPREGRITAEPA